MSYYFLLELFRPGMVDSLPRWAEIKAAVDEDRHPHLECKFSAVGRSHVLKSVHGSGAQFLLLATVLSSSLLETTWKPLAGGPQRQV